MDILTRISSVFISCQLLRGVRLLGLLLLLCCLFLSCKKNGELITIDAFAQVDEKVTHERETYSISFNLQDYPYESVHVRLGESRTGFQSGTGLNTHQAVLVAKGRYGIFLNDLIPNKKYYYQILVKDTQSDKIVHSNIYSFTTNP